jgi:hypothetical protein
MHEHEGHEHVAPTDPEDVNLTDNRRRVSAEDAVRMRGLADQIQTMVDELGALTRSYTDLDDDERTSYRFAPDLSRHGARKDGDSYGVYIEMVNGWHDGAPVTACFIYCREASVAYVESPCGSGSLLC